jgi:coproporphyrinogen III oxidase-like Fe-S oxidoreductase
MNKSKKFFNIEQYVELWETFIDQGNNSVQLYIDNPFCETVCDFCIYKSTKCTSKNINYLKYYNEYLPMLIDKFNSVLRKARVDAIYFGGGTASHMTSEILRNIIGLISGITEINIKMFEANPASLTRDKIEILSKYRFDYISLGVQTFDKLTLKKTKRKYFSPERIATLVNLIKKNGIYANCDLLTFMKTGTDEDLEVLFSDLLKLDGIVKPNVIILTGAFNTRHNIKQHTSRLVPERSF